jgi:hypothetical protein
LVERFFLRLYCVELYFAVMSHTGGAELLPLPVPPKAKGVGFGQVLAKRGARQRFKRSSCIDDRHHDLAVALNELYGQPFSGTGCSIAQASSLSELRLAVVKQCKPKDTPNANEALRELLRHRLLYEQRSDLAPYDSALLSVPNSACSSVPLIGLLNDSDSHILSGVESGLLLSQAEFQERVISEGAIKPYIDPALKNRHEYSLFIKQLVEGGMLVTVNDAISTMTPFFVKKKNGRLRLVLDARGCNQRFRKPLKPSMGGATALTNLELDNDVLYCALSDIKDCFYILQLPEWLQKYMCLPPLFVAEAGLAGLPTDILDKRGKVIPALKVLPMGWSWSVYFCQQAHENVLVRSGVVSFSQKLSDFTASPPVICQLVGWLAYVDNSLVCGTDKKEVQRVRDACDAVFKEEGLLVHEQEAASPGVDTLGVVVDGKQGTVGPTSKRLWRLYQGLTALLDGFHLNSLQLSVIVGHLTFVWCMNRMLLCIPQACYQFIEQGYEGRRALWPSVLRELR